MRINIILLKKDVNLQIHNKREEKEWRLNTFSLCNLFYIRIYILFFVNKSVNNANVHVNFTVIQFSFLISGYFCFNEILHA